MGAGVLTKGPVALAIPLLVLIPHALATGTSLRRLFPWRALGVFALVVLPWFLAVSIRIPEFPYYVLARETLQRVATGSFHRTAPFWYYLPIVPVAAFPWIVPALGGAGALGWQAVWGARRTAGAREPLLLASWVIVPLVFFTLTQSKLPQYVLPLMPAIALAATRNIVLRAGGAAWRVYTAIALLAGIALVALTRWLPAPIDLTPAEKAAIPPTALALGIALFASAALVAAGALRRRRQVVVAGYALVVITIPLVSGRLLAAVGDDRSAAAFARAPAAALDRASGTDPGRTRGIGGAGGPGGAVLGILAYPPSLAFYLGRPIAVATATGVELTSNYIADYQDRYRDVPGSPLLPEGHWRRALSRCPLPTVFVTTAANRAARAVLAAALPLIAADAHYAAYGPCVPHVRPPSPQRGDGVGG